MIYLFTLLERNHVNKLRYQTFLLTRVLQAIAYPSTQALLDAIDAACAIPETEWNARKAAFNAINDKAPLRSGKTSDISITHADIPGFLEREWYEFSSYSQMTRNLPVNNASALDEVLGKYWLTDEQIGYAPPCSDLATLDADEDSAPRM